MVITADQLHDGDWHHVVLIHSGSTMQCFIDSLHAGTLNDGLTTEFAGTGVAIGARVDGAYGFIGDIDQFRIFNKVLTTCEIKSLYYTHSPV